VIIKTFDTFSEFPKGPREGNSRVPLRPTWKYTWYSVHQTKVTGETNAQQPPKVAIPEL